MGRKISGIKEGENGWTITFFEDGGYKLQKKGSKKGTYLKPREDFLEQHREEISLGKQMSAGLRTTLGFYGLVHSGKRSVQEGRKYFGISNPITKKGDEGYKPISEEEVIETIFNFWRKEDVTHFRRGNLSLPSIGEFRRTHRRIYDHVSRKSNLPDGLKELLDKLYYPGFYNEFSKRPIYDFSESGLKELGEEIEARMYDGRTLRKSELLKSKKPEERYLARRISKLVERRSLGLFIKDFYSAIEELSGVSRSELIQSGSIGSIGKIGEELVHFVLNWGRILNEQFKVMPRGQIYRNGNDVVFEDETRKRREADGRVGEKTAIEVKTSSQGGLVKKTIDDINEKYASGKSRWDTGEQIEKCLLFLLMEDHFYSDNPLIFNQGVRVIRRSLFSRKLKKIIEGIQRNYPEIPGKIRPRMHNLDYLIDLEREISIEQTRLVQPGSNQRRVWTYDALKSLNQEARLLQDEMQLHN